MVTKMKKDEKIITINKNIYIIASSIVSFFIGIVVSSSICCFFLFIDNHFNSFSILNILKMYSFYIMTIAWAIICFMYICGLLLISKVNK